MKCKIVGMGEVLWDLLPTGRHVGGAPANYTYHAGMLGGRAELVSRVGRDEAGDELLSALRSVGISTVCVEQDERVPTGRVTVELDGAGQPRFVIHEPAAWDFIEASAEARSAVADADAICFGTLAQRAERSRRTLVELVGLSRPDCWRILDVNLRGRFYSQDVLERSLGLATVLKVNDAELPVLAKYFNLSGTDREQLRQLAREFGLRVVVLTRGERGSLIFAEGEWAEHEGVKVSVMDTVGAGDAFTAGLTLGLLRGWTLDRVNALAGRVAAYVCTQVGGTPPLPESLRDEFR